MEQMSADLTRYKLLESLANTLSDYRQGEIPPITPMHVEKWLHQFDPGDQMIILAEMDIIMRRFYFSKERIREYLRTFLSKKVIMDLPALTVLPHVRFLNIQRSGDSQKTFLKLIDEILCNDYRYPLASCGTQSESIYIYIDDAVYTGSKLRYDLTYGNDTPGWIANEAPPNCLLLLYTVAIHREGYNYAKGYILDAAREKGIKLSESYSLVIDNTKKFANSKIDVLWPEEPPGDLRHDPYITDLCNVCAQNNWLLFRDPTLPIQETLFSSPQNRRVVEQAFLKKGIQLITAGQKRADSIRPLGFMKLKSLGFGTFFVTYRNIANNCPVVLWWGDSDRPASHPLGRWYPLLPRKTNVPQW
jgi:hypothetical protein